MSGYKGRLARRGWDDYGSGEYQASRGAKTHNGVDYLADVGQPIEAPVDGWVTKLGYPYEDALEFRFVEILSSEGERHRVMYVEPAVRVGDAVRTSTVIGHAQDIAAHWSQPPKQMKNHIHHEVFERNGRARKYRHPEIEP